MAEVFIVLSWSQGKSLYLLSIATGAVDLNLQLRCCHLLTSGKLTNLSRIQLLNLQSRDVFNVSILNVSVNTLFVKLFEL